MTNTNKNAFQITLMDMEIDLCNQHTKLRKTVAELHQTMSLFPYLEGMYRGRAEKEAHELRQALSSQMVGYEAMRADINKYIEKYADVLGNPNKRTTTAYDLVKAQTATF